MTTKVEAADRDQCQRCKVDLPCPTEIKDHYFSLGQCKARPFNFHRVSLFLSFFLSVPQHISLLAACGLNQWSYTVIFIGQPRMNEDWLSDVECCKILAKIDCHKKDRA